MNRDASARRKWINRLLLALAFIYFLTWPLSLFVGIDTYTQHTYSLVLSTSPRIDVYVTGYDLRRNFSPLPLWGLMESGPHYRVTIMNDHKAMAPMTAKIAVPGDGTQEVKFVLSPTRLKGRRLFVSTPFRNAGSAEVIEIDLVLREEGVDVIRKDLRMERKTTTESKWRKPLIPALG